MGKTLRIAVAVIFLFCGFSASASDVPQNKIVVYPAPVGETLSNDYKVSAGGHDVSVYIARVPGADKVRRLKPVDHVTEANNYFDIASFAYFDMQGPANVTVTVPQIVNSVKILPSSAGISAVIHGHTISFTVPSPKNLTIEVNGEYIRCLHIFANPLETNVPRPDDPNVIYFGPGIHEVTHLNVGDNKTVYIAGGAVVRAVLGPNEKYTVNKKDSLHNYAPTFFLQGENIKFRGRGIIDASACTPHSRDPLMVRGKNIQIEGVIIRDASLWTVPIRQSDSVLVDNIKLIGYRGNSDGIDICNSRNVTVQNCFIRTMDDLVVVKADKGQGDAKHIVVKNCVLWNELAHALSIGAEIRDNVDDVLFTDCDVIHDKGREWSLRIYQCDAGSVSNVRFENIRIEESHRFVSLWIGKAVWSRDTEYGHIQGVTFKNIQAAGAPLTVELIGIDDQHGIKDVTFQHVLLNGKPLASDGIKANAFVKNVVTEP